LPSSRASAGAGWPARASVHRRETGSYTAYRQWPRTLRCRSPGRRSRRSPPPPDG
jgi:hypothetical protein